MENQLTKNQQCNTHPHISNLYWERKKSKLIQDTPKDKCIKMHIYKVDFLYTEKAIGVFASTNL